jgi:O-antigen/teichoic acid export membrane protein
MVTTGFAAAGAVGGSAAGAFVVVVAGLLVVRRAVHRKPASAHGDDSPLPRGGDQVRILAISFVLAAMLNTDIVFVNHFFDEGQAASYSAMALIGRTIFFMAGPVSIVLLPHVIRAFSSGGSVVPSLFMAVGLILGLMSATAAVILLFPAQVFGLVFREGYTLDLTILTIYAAVGTLLALNAALANLHIGVGHLRPWRGLVAITVAMVAGMLVFHESPTQIAMVLAVAVGAGAAYLAGHTVGLVRRLEHGQVVGSSA